MMSDKAIRDRWPPDSSVKLAFQTEPRRTLTSKPWVISFPSSGCNLQKLPGNSSAKMLPNSLGDTVSVSAIPKAGQIELTC
jgi:hypothetical protein